MVCLFKRNFSLLRSGFKIVRASPGQLFSAAEAVAGPQEEHPKFLWLWVSHGYFLGANSLAPSAHLYSFCQLHISSRSDFSLPEMSWDLQDECSERFPEGKAESIHLQHAQCLTVTATMMHWRKPAQDVLFRGHPPALPTLLPRLSLLQGPAVLFLPEWGYTDHAK